MKPEELQAQAREEAIQDAKAAFNRVEPEAKGKAEKMISDAKAYEKEIVNKALGDTNRFLSFYEEYKKAPDITKTRIYYERIGKLLTNTDKIYIIDKDVKSILPHFNIAGGKNE